MVFRHPGFLLFARAKSVKSLLLRQRRSAPGFKRGQLAFVISCVLVGIPAATLLPAPVLANEVSYPSGQRNYHIPAGKLSDVLAQFAATAGIPLSFDPAPLSDVRSSGLQGQYSVQQGFDRLLADSGYVPVNAGNGYALRPQGAAPRLAAVNISATLYGAKDTNSLNNSSASVGIVTAEDIAKGQIRSFREAFRQLANVNDNAYADSGFVIRGLSSEGFVPAGQPISSLYIDGILQSRDATRRGAKGLWDVEQVEVYRGPQSTLSGRAAMGGAIYIKSKDPVAQQQAEVSLTGGSRNLLNTALMVNTPISEQLAIRIAGEFERQDAPVNYPTFQQYKRIDDLDTDEYYNLRGKALITPTALPDTAILLSHSYASDRPNQRIIGTGDGFGMKDRRGDWNIPEYVEIRSIRVNNTGLDITHEFSPALRFTSLTGVNRSTTERPSVNEGTPGEINKIAGEIKNQLLTQEFRLNYEAGDFRWVAGVFASREKYDNWVDTTLMNLRNQRGDTGQKSTNLAVFGEVTWEFQPTWKATLGGRLDDAETEAWGLSLRRQPLTADPIVIADYRVKFDESNFVPKVGLSKDLSEYHVAGITYSQGFRAGHHGLNPSTGQYYTYDPESADSYELFYKGQLPDQGVQLNVNIFLTEFNDQQVEMRLRPEDPFYREVTNAASSRTWGVEVESRWQVSAPLSLFSSLGYLNSEFLDFSHFQYGDLTGKPFPDAPEWSLSLGGEYLFSNGFHISADAKYTASRLASFGVPPQEKLDAYIIANLQAGYRTARWEINAFAENLFNEDYYLTYDENGGGAGIHYGNPGDERNVGVNVKVIF